MAEIEQSVGDREPQPRGGQSLPSDATAPLPRRRLAGWLRVIARVDTDAATKSWGWLPELSLLCSCVLLLLAFANKGGIHSEPWAEPLFWVCLALLYAPIAMRVAWEGTGRRERVGLVLLLGLGMYAVKMLHSPLSFTHHDEFLHLRTVQDILNSGRLFLPNPLLPVSALFPSQESITTALVLLGDQPIFPAGVVLIAVIRVVLMLSLYVFYEHVSQSSQVAGIAALLYMANPNSLFFIAMFKYETLAIPFAVLIMLAVYRFAYGEDTNRLGMLLVVLLGLGLVVTSHHMTSYVLTAFLIVWTLIVVIRQPRGGPYLAIGAIALLSLVADLLWLFYFAEATIKYLGAPLTGAVQEFSRMITGDQKAGRQLFRSSGGRVAPLWERMTGFAAVGFIMLGLPFGLLHLWRRLRTNTAALVFACGALLYPLTLAFRFTKRGWESSNRSSETLFVAIGFVLAVGLAGILLRGRWHLLRVMAFGVVAAVISLGGLITGWPTDWRLPGPYLPQSDTRSIEPQSLTAADWARDYLGPNTRIGADRTNELLMGSYGEQWVSTTLSKGVNVMWILYAPEMGADQVALLQRGAVRYMLVDRRLTAAPHLSRSFYPNVLMTDAFAKFDRTKRIGRVFDSGDITIYDMGAFLNVP